MLMLSVQANDHLVIIMPSLSFSQPTSFTITTEQCLDDAMVVVVVGIIRYAFVFDGLLVSYSLFSILVYPGIDFCDCRRRN